MVIPARRPHRENQKPRYAAIPSATAALLAATAIPQRKSVRRRKAVDTYYGPRTPPNNASFDYEVSIEGEEDEDSAAEQLQARSALEVLLSPPDDDEEYDSSPMERSNSDSQLSVRSSSTESVPSLDTDNESTCSFSSSWSQPAQPRRSDSRSRIVTSPPIECDSNHPLMFTPPEEEATQEPEVAFLAEDMVKRVTRRLNLVSNLTASIRVLKSAAKSFSSLTASATAIQQPDDYLTRSILSISPQYTDERRPKPSEEEVTPALRRYLNPWSSLHEESPCTGSVQMQTYDLNSRRSKSARTGRTESMEDESCACGPMVRQREVRENADFLRVIVLEMNMRREGKLSDTAQGKARYMLPPRQACKLRAIGDPGRWEAWVCMYET
ncbi:hypothetical protein K440DRAFT_562257 [Wilcoxina mikolae CBS 423.85]|nr:hypothetical protein K440DRAFT_562257 [Wilcoxina mikolae CBS 423.85]